MNKQNQVALVAALILLLPVQGFSCLCHHLPSLTEAAKASPLIFSGRLVQVTSIPEQGYSIITYKFTVSKTWRGVKTDTITLQTGSSSCLAELENGQSYVLFTDPKQEISMCQRITRTNLMVEEQKLDKLFRHKRFQKLQVIN